MKKNSFLIGSFAALSLVAISCGNNNLPADVISSCKEYTV